MIPTHHLQAASTAAQNGDRKMMTSFAGQTAAAVSAVMLLVDYLLGITLGMFGGLTFASVRENYSMSMLEPAPDRISAGARAVLMPFIQDDGYLRSLPPGRSGVPRASRRVPRRFKGRTPPDRKVKG